jgi:hypothetical protein
MEKRIIIGLSFISFCFIFSSIVLAEDKIVVGIQGQLKQGIWKKDLGHDFFISEPDSPVISGYVPPKSLFYENKKIDEVDDINISPSGRYAVYNKWGGVIVLFDTKDSKKYLICKGGSPKVNSWGEEEESFILKYFTGEYKTVQIRISELKPL